MSQPKRRSRKTKLVPRSTEGGDPEIEEVIETEEEQIQVRNTMSLVSSQPRRLQPQPAPKKSESLQFKVDIEVEEWIDDELFIEENFAKMQSEKLSEALDKEIQEEADWTNDEYGKLWAEAASDSDTEEKPLNEYEKLIKNQFDLNIIAGPSKTPSPENAKTVEKIAPSKKDEPTTSKPIPKPTLNIKQYIRPIKKVSPVNLQPKLRINIVFDTPDTEDPVTNQADDSKRKRSSPVRIVKNKSSVIDKCDKPQSNIKVINSRRNSPVYLIPAKADTPNEMKNVNDVVKSPESKKPSKKIEVIPSTSDTIENIDKILEKPIYFIEVDKPPAKINRAQLRHMAYKSIMKHKPREKSIDLKHIVVNEDEILSAADKLSQVNDRITKTLCIEVRNRLGSTRFESIEISREDALIEYVFRQWSVWQGLSKTRAVPLLYKCYICNDGWWHLEPFRAHIKKHSYVQVGLEKHNQECNVIAHDGKHAKFKIFPIDNECWRCGKSYSFHLGLEQVSYKCEACDSSLYTCLGLMEHMGICLNVWKKHMNLYISKDVKAFKCKICPQIFFTENELHQHQYMFHVPRSDYPMLTRVRQCSFCNQNYLVYTFHYCRSKVLKHFCKDCLKHFPSNIAVGVHLQVTKLNVQCEFCDVVVKRECCMTEHLLEHTDKFMMVYKCLICPNNIMLEDLLMVQRHIIYVHKSMKTPCSCAKIIIPRSLYYGNKYTIQCKPSVKTQSVLKPLILDEGSKSTELKTSEPSKDSNESNQEDNNISSNEDDTSQASKQDDTNQASEQDDTRQASKQDNNSHESSLVETIDTESKPTVKIENIMEDYYEESSNMDTEIDTKPTGLPVAEIKMEVEEASTEFSPANLMDFENVFVKEEKPVDSEKSSKNTESQEFTEQLQNFFENMDVEYETLNQRGTDIKDNMYVCVSCDFEGTKRQYNKHLKDCKTAVEKYDERECTKCEKTFKSMKDYVVHLRVHGFGVCHCKECDVKFLNLTSWSNHINTHISKSFAAVKLLSNEAKVFMCKICKDIVQRNMFFKHWEVHIHQEQSLELRSDMNSSISRKLLGIIIDIFQATVKKTPKDCVVCGRPFMRMNEKKRHLVEHLLEAASEQCRNSGVLQCQICRAGFDKRDLFRRHMRVHAGLPVYHCDLCDKTFSDSSNFVKHKKVHNGEAYVCDMCNKKFLAKTSLVAHIATHSPEPISCARCPDKVFYCESAYRRHVRIYHDRINSFGCNRCRRRFHTIREKWDHQWEAHQMRSQIADCPECDKKFRKVSSLRKHLAEVHSAK